MKVILPHTISGTYGGDDNGYGAAAAEADFEADFLIECEVDQIPAEFGSDCPVKPLTWCHESERTGKWKTFDDSECPFDIDDLAGELEEKAQEEIHEALKDYGKVAPGEEGETWNYLFRRWAEKHKSVAL